MPYSVKGFFEINEDMVQILLMLEVLFTQNSKVEDLFCGASSGSEPSLFFSNYFFSLGFQPIQDDFQHDFARMTDEADSSANEEVRRKIQAAIGEYDELLPLVKKRKLRWFGHVSRSSGLAKTILQGTVKGKRKRGRQKKRWEDNIKEWTGMDFASSTRAAENRSRWKVVVANSSVVPRRPSKVMG